MYLSSRRRHINPAHARQAVAVAIEAGKRASAICGLDVSVWTTTMSPDAGEITWGARVEHLADLETAFDKLAIDDSFNTFVEQNDNLFVGPLVDTLERVVAGPMAEPGTGRPAYVSVAQATCANGTFAAAMAGGMELAEMVARIGGLPTSFLVAVNGGYGAVSWITAAPDLATLEASEEKVNNAPEFVALVDRISPCYQPHASVALLRRLS